MRIFGIAILDEDFLREPIWQHADSGLARLGQPVERRQKLSELRLRARDLAQQIDGSICAGLELKLATEPVRHRGQKLERSGEQLIDAAVPIDFEHGVVVDRKGAKRQRDVDAEIPAAATATGPEQIGVL